MVLATRTSAPTTSLAVIRPKPRPDSPTASEISVIMLKSELPHEAPNPVSKEGVAIVSVDRVHGYFAANQIDSERFRSLPRTELRESPTMEEPGACPNAPR